MFVICYMNAGRSPSDSGQTTACQCLERMQKAQIRMWQVRNVSSTTFSKARKSPSFSNSVLRPTPRLRTWYTNPPGNFRDARGMHIVYLNCPALSNSVAGTFAFPLCLPCFFRFQSLKNPDEMDRIGRLPIVGDGAYNSGDRARR